MYKLFEVDWFCDHWEEGCQEVINRRYTEEFSTNQETIECLCNELELLYDGFRNNELSPDVPEAEERSADLLLMYSVAHTLYFIMDCSM